MQWSSSYGTHAYISRSTHCVLIYGGPASLRCLPSKGELFICSGGQVDSPLLWQEWDARLSSYPNQRLRAYIVDGIRYSFRAGYNCDSTCRSCRGNMRSTLENPHVIQDYLWTKCEAGRIVGPPDPSCHPHVYTSWFGVTPKSTPWKWRLIVDMSSPKGGSVNDGVKEPWYSLPYATVTDAAHKITAYERDRCWLNLISEMCTEWFQFIQRTGG